MPEFARCFLVELPSVRMFAECFLVRHSANREFDRVSESLPSVFSLALGKEMVCRVSDKIHSTKNMTLDKSFESGSGTTPCFRSSRPCSMPCQGETSLAITVSNKLPCGKYFTFKTIAQRLSGKYINLYACLANKAWFTGLRSLKPIPPKPLDM